MSESIKLGDFAKSRPLGYMKDAGLYLLGFNSNGDFKRVQGRTYNFISLTNKEEPKSSMTVVDFAKKYLKDVPPGLLLGDSQHSFANQWYINVKGIALSTQQYRFLVLSNQYKGLAQTWDHVSFLALPSGAEAKGIYVVRLSTGESADTVTVSAQRIMLTDFGS